MRILLHVCCGPCATFPVKQLREDQHEITGYFYNPNIHPYKEFQRRLETLKEYATKSGFSLKVDDNYTLEEYLERVMNSETGRCRECYMLRLRQAAKIAKTEGFEAFTTTLLVSPYQKHDIIQEVGTAVGEEAGIPFYYYDFRIGWNEGVTISKDLELYRQPYCGCIFSEKERYMKKKSKE